MSRPDVLGQVEPPARGPRRRRHAAVVTSVLVVVGLAVAVPLLRDGTSGDDPPPAAAPPPAGLQSVSWHGLQLHVPDTWELDDAFCGTAQSDTVLRPGDVEACLPPYVPGLTVVEYTGGVEEVPGARDVQVSGFAGRRGTVPLTEESGTRDVLTIPELEVTVSVRSPDGARAAQVLDTAAVIDVDDRGCVVELPATTPPEPTVPGAEERVLPGRPDRVVLCAYGDLLLESSTALSAEDVREVQRLLDAAPVGTSPSRVGVTVSAEVCPEYDRRPMVLQATYADGEVLQVFTRMNSCTGPDPDNGARRVIADDFAIALFQLTHG